ncbi:MAG: hypothetical protein ACR2NO_10140 [Chloroflexota bacterium]
MTTAEDDFREQLFGWQQQIEEDIAVLSDTGRKWDPESDRETQLSFAHKRQELVELLLGAMGEGDTWAALNHAVMLGIYSGITQASPYTYHAKRKLRLYGPAILRGEKNMRATISGGLIEERERVQRRLEAARLKKAHDDDVAYKSMLRAKSEEYRARLMPLAVAVGDLMPRCLWYLSQLSELDKESFESEGELWAETGIPHGLAATVLAAIRETSQEVEWHYDFVGNPNATNPLPTLKIRKQLMIQAGATDIHGNRVNPDGSPASYRLPAGIAWLPPAR